MNSGAFRKMAAKALPPGGGSAIGALVAGAGALYAAANSFFNVEGGHRAIVFNKIFGVKDQVYTEGTHLMIPFLEMPVDFDVRAKANDTRSTSGSRDLQMVNISLRVLTRPVADNLPHIYRTLGTDYAERVLPSIVQETLKSVIAQYNASELLTMRESVSKEIRRVLEIRARQFNIALDDVSITALTFGKEYTLAVEAKQVAQQEAQRARFIVDKALQDKQSAIIRAEGEAQSARMIGKAIANNPAFLSLRRIEAAREISETISRSANRVYLNADTLMLNLENEAKDGNNRKA